MHHSKKHEVTNFPLRIIFVSVIIGLTIIALAALGPLLTAGDYGLAYVVSNPEKIDEYTAQFEGELSTGALVNVAVDVNDVRFFNADGELQLAQGDRVIVQQVDISGSDQQNYYVLDKFFLDKVVVLVAIFLILSIVLLGGRGLRAIAGLIFSLVVLVGLVVPAIVRGLNPLLVTFAAAAVIATIGMMLAHGLRRQILIAIAGTLATLSITAILGFFAANWLGISGAAEEEAIFLLSAGGLQIDLRGIYLASVVIGTLGVLDDITTAQVAVVAELQRLGEKLNPLDLFRRALNVGDEHIIALINTLVLAYVGAAFPLFILIVINSNQPLWLMLNNPTIIEEVVRTLVGSMGLILAVPITTGLAVYFLKTQKQGG